MFIDEKWYGCNRLYLWTAGQWVIPKTKSKFVWKWAVTMPHSNRDLRNKDMSWFNWFKSPNPARHQPDNYFGNEACVNLAPPLGYTWNDEPCNKKYCFICEDRRFPLD